MQSIQSEIKENKLMPKTEKLINEMLKDQVISKEEMQAILNVVCPFPDGPIVNARWPAGTGGSTATTHVQALRSLARPPGVSEGTPWKMHATIMPVTTNSSSTWAESSWQTTGNLVPIGNSSSTMCTIAVIGVADGDPFPEYGTLAWDNALMAQWNPFDNFEVTQTHRITGLGFELINTSSDLYRGGYASAYRVKTPEQSLTHFWTGAAFTANTNFARASMCLPSPPVNQSEITNYPTTYVGDARHGVVALSTPNSFDNPLRQGMPSEVFLLRGGGSNNVLQCLTAMPVHDWAISGAFVTGQPSEATWTLRPICYLEFIPTPTANTNISALLAGMATPEHQLSVVAFAAMSHVLEKLPAGFNYKDNPLGEWFHKVLGFIKQAAPRIGEVLSFVHPAANIIGRTSGAVAEVLHGLTTEAKKKKKLKDIKATEIMAIQSLAKDLAKPHPSSPKPPPAYVVKTHPASTKLVQNAKQKMQVHPAAQTNK